MADVTDPNLKAAEDARAEALLVLSTAGTLDELKQGIETVYTARRPRHGHEAAQILNFLEFRDPTKLLDVPLDTLKTSLARLAAANPGDPRAREYLTLLG